MFDNGNERAGVEESYQVAGNTSDLTVEADRRGAGDVIIAAGWSQSRVGMALLRLHSEWDSAAKPRKQGRAQIEAAAAIIKASDARAKESAALRGEKYKKPEPPIVQAHKLAQQWYTSELRLLATGLKSRAAVWEQLAPWLAQKGVDPALGALALLHWLDPTCTACDGLKLKKVEGQPALSARQCNRCHGTGQATHPEGTARVLSYLDDCVSKARQSLKNRLRNT